MLSFIKTKAFWVKQAKDLLKIFVFSIPGAYLACRSCFEDPNRRYYLIVLNFLVWVIMWKGNSFVNGITNKYYNWLEAPVKRLIAGVLVHTVYTMIAIVSIFYTVEAALDISLGNIHYTLIFSLIATILISLVLHSIEFFKSWREVAVESERMKKEVISAKYESLKNQVNPHFLFNSLNALTNLVYEDQDQAARFIKKLSEVYRYVLESRDKELVSLSTELKFVESYLFLQKIRFGDNLKVNLSVDQRQGYEVPPLAVQMLLENAIKHNVISSGAPLTIAIEQEENYLIVSNNLQKKNIVKSESSSMGLPNIKARYSFLSSLPVVVDDSNNIFTVKLPLLKLV